MRHRIVPVTDIPAITPISMSGGLVPGENFFVGIRFGTKNTHLILGKHKLHISVATYTDPHFESFAPATPAWHGERCLAKE
jgi:hypothetical protein